VTLGHSNQANNNCFPFTLVHMLVKDLPTFQIHGLHMHAIYKKAFQLNVNVVIMVQA